MGMVFLFFACAVQTQSIQHSGLIINDFKHIVDKTKDVDIAAMEPEEAQGIDVDEELDVEPQSEEEDSWEAAFDKIPGPQNEEEEEKWEALQEEKKKAQGAQTEIARTKVEDAFPDDDDDDDETELEEEENA